MIISNNDRYLIPPRTLTTCYLLHHYIILSKYYDTKFVKSALTPAVTTSRYHTLTPPSLNLDTPSLNILSDIPTFFYVGFNNYRYCLLSSLLTIDTYFFTSQLTTTILLHFLPIFQNDDIYSINMENNDFLLPLLLHRLL